MLYDPTMASLFFASAVNYSFKTQGKGGFVFHLSIKGLPLRQLIAESRIQLSGAINFSALKSMCNTGYVSYFFSLPPLGFEGINLTFIQFLQ